MKKCVLLLQLLSAVHGFGQALHSISGFVCTRGTSVRVAGVIVTNVRTNAVTAADDLGVFTINAAIGDSIEFSKEQYTTTRLAVTGLADMIVFLRQTVLLDQVTVKGQTRQQELNDVMNDYRKKGVYYNGKPSALSAIMSPLNALYSVFGSDPKNARHFAEYAKRETEAAQDSKKYNKAIVKQVTGLPDDEVDKFMDTYRPVHQDMLKWSSYDIIAYIKRSYETYKKFGAKGLPALTGKLPDN